RAAEQEPQARHIDLSGIVRCGGKPNVSVAGGIRVTRGGAGDGNSTNPIIDSISCGGGPVQDYSPPCSGGMIDPTSLMNKARFPFNFLYRELGPQGKSLPPPALSECRHRDLACLSKAVRWRAILVEPEG